MPHHSACSARAIWRPRHHYVPLTTQCHVHSNAARGCGAGAMAKGAGAPPKGQRCERGLVRLVRLYVQSGWGWRVPRPPLQANWQSHQALRVSGRQRVLFDQWCKPERSRGPGDGCRTCSGASFSRRDSAVDKGPWVRILGAEGAGCERKQKVCMREGHAVP